MVGLQLDGNILSSTKSQHYSKIKAFKSYCDKDGNDTYQVLRHLEVTAPASEMTDRELSVKTASLTFFLSLSRFDIDLFKRAFTQN